MTAAKPRVPKPRVPVPVGAPPLRHHAAELGVDLTRVSGTGPHGEVTRPMSTVLPRRREPVPGPRRHWSGPRRRSGRLRPGLAVRTPARRGARGGPGEGQRHRTQRRGPAEDVRRAAETSARRGLCAGRGARGSPGGRRGARVSERSARATDGADARAKREIPHYYVATTVDLSTATEWLRRTNRERPVSERLAPAALLLKATALAARQHPELNGFWADGRFVPGEDVPRRGRAYEAAPWWHRRSTHRGPRPGRGDGRAARPREAGPRRAGCAVQRWPTPPSTSPTSAIRGRGGHRDHLPPQVALIGVGRIVERPWAVDGMIGVRPTVRSPSPGTTAPPTGPPGPVPQHLEQLLLHPEEL